MPRRRVFLSTISLLHSPQGKLQTTPSLLPPQPPPQPAFVSYRYVSKSPKVGNPYSPIWEYKNLPDSSSHHLGSGKGGRDGEADVYLDLREGMKKRSGVFRGEGGIRLL